MDSLQQSFVFVTSRPIAELSLPRYLWTLIKNTSCAERLCCVASLLLVIACIGIIISVTSVKPIKEDEYDFPQDHWKVTRKEWLAGDRVGEPTMINKSAPIVIVNHSGGTECHRVADCSAELRNLQAYFIGLPDGYGDLPYNFIIGNDGRAYEGRGWGLMGAHHSGLNSCSMGLGFVGDYREELAAHSVATTLQMNRTRMLLEEGVRLGYLHKNYIILGAKDLKESESPGSSLHNAIMKLPHYDHAKRAYGLNCQQLVALVHETDD